jgi:hypothetical protein
MRQPSTAPRPRAGAIAEVIAISVTWPCALAVCGVGLVTQNTQLALEGLGLFFATYFYTLVRLYQLGSSNPELVKPERAPFAGAIRAAR